LAGHWAWHIVPPQAPTSGWQLVPQQALVPVLQASGAAVGHTLLALPQR
jgi:hypothetical protein